MKKKGVPEESRKIYKGHNSSSKSKSKLNSDLDITVFLKFFWTFFRWDLIRIPLQIQIAIEYFISKLINAIFADDYDLKFGWLKILKFWLQACNEGKIYMKLLKAATVLQIFWIRTIKAFIKSPFGFCITPILEKYAFL